MCVKRIFTALSSCLLCLSCMSLPAFAEVALPEGAVKGLPEKLTAMDSDGRAVNSATGEYFFHVENMDYGVTYTKEVQIMNLRDDKSYHIYFYVEPLFKDGEIDLEKGCECVFQLDGQEFYRGTVTGDGNFDLTKKFYDCGLYDPGESHTLKCAVTWNDLDVLNTVDNGHRLVDVNGEPVMSAKDFAKKAKSSRTITFSIRRLAATRVVRKSSASSSTSVRPPNCAPLRARTACAHCARMDFSR